eukprot:Nk52_evm27s152 gene=Nk52_evmTU27s152
MERDFRFLWLEARVSSCLKPRTGSFRLLLDNENFALSLNNFLTKEGVGRLVIYFDKKGFLGASNDPLVNNQKSVIFFKLRKTVLNQDNIANDVVHSSCSEEPLLHFYSLIHDIYFPLLSCPENQKGWENEAQKIMENYHQFLNQTCMVIGQTRGDTLLPLPPKMMTKVSFSPGEKLSHSDKEKIHVLESAIVNWTKQIKGLLKLDPESLVKGGKNPGPLAEVDFWSSKAENLKSVYEQLVSEPILLVLNILEATKSSYAPAFSRIAKEVALANGEANENIKYLNTLKPFFSALGTVEFLSISRICRPMFETLFLVWKHCKYYNNTNRFMQLIRLVCNAIIKRCRERVEGSSILKREPAEAFWIIRDALKVCASFRGAYHDYKIKADEYFTKLTLEQSEETPPEDFYIIPAWPQRQCSAYYRFNMFLERSNDILDLTQTAMHFQKLENMEIGGTCGKQIGLQIFHIFNEFENNMQHFRSLEYDVLDIDHAQSFDDRFYKFRCGIKDLERRLATCINQSFESATNIAGKFKLLDIFDGLTGRPIINTSLEDKYVTLTTQYKNEIKSIVKIFEEEKDNPSISAGMPQYAGKVRWSEGILERLNTSMDKFKAMSDKATDSADGKELATLYSTLLTKVKEFQKVTVSKWKSFVETQSNNYLNMPLLKEVSDSSSEIPIYEVNVAQEFVCQLKEIKYLESVGLTIPKSALHLYQPSEDFFRQSKALTMILKWYTSLTSELEAMEKPLFQKKFEEIQDMFVRGARYLHWKSYGIDEYISDLYSLIMKEAHKALFTVTRSHRSIIGMISEWSTLSSSLFDYLEDRGEECFSVAKLAELHKTSSFYQEHELSDTGLKIHSQLLKSLKALKLSKGDPVWIEYVNAIDQLIFEGLQNAVRVSLKKLFSILTDDNTSGCVTIYLELITPDLVYSPPISEKSGPNSLFQLLHSWMDQLYDQGKLIARVNDPDADYFSALKGDSVLQGLARDIEEVMRASETKCDLFARVFHEKYSSLWNIDIHESFQKFLSPKGLDKNRSPRRISTAPGNVYPLSSLFVTNTEKTPCLEEFDLQIRSYMRTQYQILGLPNDHNFKWIKINCKPIKQALNTWTNKWVFSFTRFLMNQAVTLVTEFEEFIEEIEGGLSEVPPDEEEMPLFMQVMQSIRKMRAKQDNIDKGYPSIKVIVEILQKYNYYLPQKQWSFYCCCQSKWSSLKRKVISIKEKLGPRMQKEGQRVSKDLVLFNEKVKDFRQEFLKSAPFGRDWSIPSALESLQAHSASLKDMETQAQSFLELQELLDSSNMQFLDLSSCRWDVDALRQVWGLFEMIDADFKIYTGQNWKAVDIKTITDMNKSQESKVLSLSNAVKNWDIYKYLVDSCENLKVSLPFIEKMRTEAMRERHWKQLKRMIGVACDTRLNMTFGEVLDLNLHKHIDAVKTIMERAKNELSIEKSLKKFGEVWASKTLSFHRYERGINLKKKAAGDLLEVVTTNNRPNSSLSKSDSSVPGDPSNDPLVLANCDDIFDMLESNQVTVQQIHQSKFVSSFSEEVMKWEKRLQTVEMVLTVWLEVQYSWATLEEVFLEKVNADSEGMGSFDSSIQQHAMLFASIDKEWKQLMSNAFHKPNVVETCSKEGFLMVLEKMQQNLEHCEKSFIRFLEEKRKSFPRFYFLSSTDLVQFFCRGNHPYHIDSHIAKLFSNIRGFEFEHHSGKPTKSIVGFHSRQGEYFEFQSPLECDGALETWIKKLESHSRECLRSGLKESVEGILDLDKDARKKWVQNQSSQLTQAAVNIMWTGEIEKSLSGKGLSELKEKCATEMSQLQSYFSFLGSADNNTRLFHSKLSNLITVYLYKLEMIKLLLGKEVNGDEEFVWKTHMRYYLSDDKQSLQVCMGSCQIQYGFEYIGNRERLITTPVTEKCLLSMCQSFKQCSGAAVIGGSGIGKTQTCIDLGNAVAAPHVVANYSPHTTITTLCNMLIGMAATGTWLICKEVGLFSDSILSVLACQMATIYDCLKKKKDSFSLIDGIFPLVDTFACIFTLNIKERRPLPLPLNLKKLLRMSSIIVPDCLVICQGLLEREGFKNGAIIGKKIKMVHSLSNEGISSSAYYDWGLRAIRPVVKIASLMRAKEPHLSEEEVAYHSLVGYHMQKLGYRDSKTFIAIVESLFPQEAQGLKSQQQIKDAIIKISKSSTIEPCDNLISKVIQLDQVLHSSTAVFLIGPAGCGKSTCLKTFSKVRKYFDFPCSTTIINPKAVSLEQLLGYALPMTSDWKDGILSSRIKSIDDDSSDSQALNFIVLDGAVDSGWVESLHSVMDEVKALTLPNNERILVADSVRLIFEVDDLSNVSPSTISRAAMITFQPLSWGIMVESWLVRRTNQKEKDFLRKLIHQYANVCIEYVSKSYDLLVPISEIYMITTFFDLIDTSMKAINYNEENMEKVLANVVNFAAIWGFGGCISNRKGSADHRQAFSDWWLKEWGGKIDFPRRLTSCWNYYVDNAGVPKTWDANIGSYFGEKDPVIGDIFVGIPETERISHLLGLLFKGGKPVMLVGDAGTGKTSIVHDKIQQLIAGDDMLSLNIAVNSATSARVVRDTLDGQLERKLGRTYEPPHKKKLICLVDDLNLAEVDSFGVQSTGEFIRQHVDHGGFYDTDSLLWRDVKNVVFVATVNPSSGASAINSDRLQRHFATFLCPYPCEESLINIYANILDCKMNKSQRRQSTSDLIINNDQSVTLLRATKATIELQSQLRKTFTPAADKYHYIFNMRDISVVFRGIAMLRQQCDTPLQLARLWSHECRRTYGDRLATPSDCQLFEYLITEASKKYFEDIDQKQIHIAPLIYTSLVVHENVFYNKFAASNFTRIDDYNTAKIRLEELLRLHNNIHPNMDLILFNDVIEHICKLTRILSLPYERGSALLIGSPGSGKQSLTKLAAFICGFEIYRLTTNELEVFKSDFTSLYLKAGLKGFKVLCIFTQAQAKHNEKFMVYLNDYLSSGYIGSLFSSEERNNINNSIRSEVKQAGLLYSREVAWNYFIQKVKRNFRIVICTPGTGPRFNEICCKFPAIINCTSIVWFSSWSKDALIAIAYHFLAKVDFPSDAIRENISHYMANIHITANEAGANYMERGRRSLMGSHKSYLEYISHYSTLTHSRLEVLKEEQESIANGIKRIVKTSKEAAELQNTAEHEKDVLDEKKNDCNKLLSQIGQDMLLYEEQKELHETEEKLVEKVKERLQNVQEKLNKETEKTNPIKEASDKLLENLNKDHIQQIRSIHKPTQEISQVFEAVIYILTPRKTSNIDVSWSAAKRMMAHGDRFIDSLKKLNTGLFSNRLVEILEEYLERPQFNASYMTSISPAIATIIQWIEGSIKYFKSLSIVRPLQEELKASRRGLEASLLKLENIVSKIDELESRLKHLGHCFELASKEKTEQNAKVGKIGESLAQTSRFIKAVEGEKRIWDKKLVHLKEQEKTIVGDLALALAFMAYMGPFSERFREQITVKVWRKELEERAIPFNSKMFIKCGRKTFINIEYLVSCVVDEGTLSSWKFSGLTLDKHCLENGAIMATCRQWPLLVDPQNQGYRWVQDTERDNGLEVLDMAVYDDSKVDARNTIIERMITEGKPLLIKNVDETLDRDWHNLLVRSIANSSLNGQTSVRTNDKEIQYNPKFKLYMTTSGALETPELACYSTIVNCKIERDGLEEMFLNLVLDKERPELKDKYSELLQGSENVRKESKDIEYKLLHKLTTAHTDVLEETQNIEDMVTMGRDLKAKLKTLYTEMNEFGEKRNLFRPFATRCATLFFLLDSLYCLDHMYRFSLESFLEKVKSSIINEEPPSEDMKLLGERVYPESVQVYIDKVTFATVLMAKQAMKHKDFMTLLVRLSYELHKETTYYKRIQARKKEKEEKEKADQEKRDIAIAEAVEKEKLAKQESQNNEENEEGEESAEQGNEASQLAAQKTVPVADDDEHHDTEVALNSKMQDAVADADDNEAEEEIVDRLPDDFLNSRNISSVTPANSHSCIGLYAKEAPPAVYIFNKRAYAKFLQRSMDPDIDYLYLLGEKIHTKTIPEREELIQKLSGSLSSLNEGQINELLNLSLTVSGKRMYKSMVENYDKWVEWGKSNTFWEESGPLEMSNFEKLMAIKCIFPQKINAGLDKFVKSTLGENVVTYFNSSIESIMPKSKKSEPILLVVDSDYSTLSEVLVMAEKEGKSEEAGTLKTISAGKNCEAEVLSCLHSLCKENAWMILENIHLIDSDSRILDSVMSTLKNEDLHENFRLILTSEALDTIPNDFIQACYKMGEYPRICFKNCLLRSLETMALYTTGLSSNKELMSSAFNVSFCYAALQYRHKFNPKGYVGYPDFCDNSLMHSFDLLKEYSENTKSFPWRQVQHLLETVSFGGYVTNDFDLRVVKCFIEKFIVESSRDGKALVGSFKSISSANLDELQQHVEKNFPSREEQAVRSLGLSEYDLNKSSKKLWQNVFAGLQTLYKDSVQVVVESNKLSNQEKIRSLYDFVTETLPNPFSMAKKTGNESFFEIVFMQECVAMNNLIKSIKSSLETLDLCLRGHIFMALDNLDLMNTLCANEVPTQWKHKSFESSKKLDIWLREVVERCAQLEQFLKTRVPPRVLWFGGLYKPSAFLLALRKEIGLKKNWELDETDVLFEITSYTSEKEIKTDPDDGHFLKGLYVEGGDFDKSSLCLIRNENPEDDLVELPIVLCKVVNSTSLKGNTKIFNMPGYIDKNRNKLAFMANMSIGVASQDLILSGTCLLCEAGEGQE